MRILVVLRVVAVLLLIVSVFLLLPVLVAMLYHEDSIIWSFLAPMVLVWLVCVPILLLTGRAQGATISNKGGYLLVSSGWILAAAFSALPFFLSGAIPHYTDAFFETMSGYTTTGASILTNIEALPKAMLFWRSLTHWLGGMGIVVLTVAVFPLLGIGGLQLVKAEAPGPTVDKITPKITSTAKILWLIYVLMTVAEIILLMFGGMSLFDAATHTFGTVATGGFSPRNASVGSYHSGYIDVVITVFMMLAGMNFLLYYRAVIGDFRSVLRNSELRTYVGIFVVAALLIALNLDGHTYHSFGRSLRFASFQAASILTTTGFTTTNYATWPVFSQVVLFVLMFVGGSTGSTGGGIKVARIVILLKQGVNEMRYLLHPRGIFSMKLSGLNLRKDIVYTVTGFVFLYLFVLFITTLVVASGGNDILTSLTAALATLGNIGPGFGKVGPVSNYAYLPTYIKWFLSFSMVVGRLEIYTVLVIFTRTFWKR